MPQGNVTKKSTKTSIIKPSINYFTKKKGKWGMDGKVDKDKNKTSRSK